VVHGALVDSVLVAGSLIGTALSAADSNRYVAEMVTAAERAASRPVLGRVPLTGRVLIDSRWVTGQRIPALGRRIVMTCSLSLEPDM
jgi:hypothetical protein